MSEPTAPPNRIAVQIIPHEKPVPSRRPFAIKPLQEWQGTDAVAFGLRHALVEWLLGNSVTRMLEEREIVVDPTTVSFWRSGFDPLAGDVRPVQDFLSDSVVRVQNLQYQVKIKHQPPPGLLARLAADGLLVCSATATMYRPATLSGREIWCRELVDAEGRHAGDHRDPDTAGQQDNAVYVWGNLHPARYVANPELSAEAEQLHQAGVMAALAVMDRNLIGLPVSMLGGMPKVGREGLFAAVNAAAKELLGENWATDLRVACEALRNAQEGTTQS